ncbi:CsbD family protein [Spirulina sp. CCNP1310]|uniref:CsbD family protein n=1 Tax=Spirulina sp. CCNP1310 TaxID=3110249 RepID=UPI002B1F75A9|nr:CsbD family protein [Spirulina sp. CCNP1310]MEA5418638.1 CsbD family protein [Spirulina sp. CCNP1310]
MGLGNKAKTAAKDLEGKTQEAVGKMTDNHEGQAKGKAKQAEAKVEKAVEDGKDNIKGALK